jgi:signal transduction histidine kinase
MAEAACAGGTALRAPKPRTPSLCKGVRRWVRQLAAWVLLCMAMQAIAQTLELRQARASVTIQGQTTQQAVQLPYHWDRIHSGEQGVATFELPFTLAELPDRPYGLYVTRLGNAYEIWLNGVLLEHNGDMRNFNGADYAKSPRFVDITPGLLRADNVFRVHIRVDKGRRGGLAPLVLGPLDEVQRLYEDDYRLRNIGSMVVVVLSLLVGGLALALWATQAVPAEPGQPGRPLRDRLYLLAAIAELSWTVNVGDVLIETPPFGWPWWGMLTIAATAVWVCTMALFCIEVAGWWRHQLARWLGRWILLLLAANPVATVAALAQGHALALTLWYGALGLTCLALVPAFLYKAVRGGSIAHRMVAAALLLNTLVGLRDIYAFRVSVTYGGTTMLRYSSILFGLALAFVVIARLRSTSGQVRDLVSGMAARVQAKEIELQQSYEHVATLAREQVRADERTRILRDMHDGVGSHISTAIRQLQSGKADGAEVLHTLRDSLDHLKLSIDAMNVPPGDITALLANVRYRLEPRFLACDIRLVWDVDLLEPVAKMDASAMAQLQFMLFEGFSNVLQHANASTLCVSAHLCETPACGVRLQIIDDGCGFDVKLPRGSGLSSMHDRARSIGARLDLSSAPGCTVVEITLGSAPPG